MFLKEVTVRNFRSINDAKVSFEPGVNIIIGPNGSGKSNLLAFLQTTISYANFRLSTNRFLNIDVNLVFNINQQDLQLSLKKERILIGDDVKIKIHIANSKFDDIDQSEFLFINEDIEKGKRTQYNKLMRKFLEKGLMSKTFVGFNIPSNIPWLDTAFNFVVSHDLNLEIENYTGISHFLFRLEDFIETTYMVKVFGSEQKKYKPKTKPVDVNVIEKIILEAFESAKNYNNLNANLKNYSPIQDIRLSKNINLNYSEGKLFITNCFIEFKINGNWILWNQLSDGTKRLFYIISQTISSNSYLLLIEEPELGIHPAQLFKLMDLFSNLSREKQIIISTHSPIVLDMLSSEDLSRITIAKITSKGSNFKKLSKNQIVKAKEYMNSMELSYYWLHSDLEK